MYEQKFAVGVVSDERQGLTAELVEDLRRLQQAESLLISRFACRFPHHHVPIR